MTNWIAKWAATQEFGILELMRPSHALDGVLEDDEQGAQLPRLEDE